MKRNISKGTPAQFQNALENKIAELEGGVNSSTNITARGVDLFWENVASMLEETLLSEYNHYAVCRRATPELYHVIVYSDPHKTDIVYRRNIKPADYADQEEFGEEYLADRLAESIDDEVNMQGLGAATNTCGIGCKPEMSDVVSSGGVSYRIYELGEVDGDLIELDCISVKQSESAAIKFAKKYSEENGCHTRVVICQPDPDDEDEFYTEQIWISTDESITSATVVDMDDTAGVERYIHTLIGDLQSVLEDSGLYSTVFDSDATNLYVTVARSDEDVQQYEVPLEDLNFDWDNINQDVDYIFEAIVGGHTDLDLISSASTIDDDNAITESEHDEIANTIWDILDYARNVLDSEYDLQDIAEYGSREVNRNGDRYTCTLWLGHLTHDYTIDVSWTSDNGSLVLDKSVEDYGQEIVDIYLEEYGYQEGYVNSATNSNTTDFEITDDGELTRYKGSSRDVVIPDGVTSIEDGAFARRKRLRSVTISNSVTSIGDWAFSHCSSLEKVTIPHSVTSIGDWTFSGCSSLKSMTIPNSVTSIGDGVFESCESLTSITIPNRVTSIGESAFENCPSLKSVTIPDSVTSIGDYAFRWCTNLTRITIPDSVISIGSGAFDRCNKLPEDVIDYISQFYGYEMSSKEKYLYTSNLSGFVIDEDGELVKYKGSSRDVIIPDSVTSIGDSAFRGLTHVTSITIPDSITSIGDYAFAGCINSKTITIPNSVISIGKWAFYDCYRLTTITIPDSVTSIGDYAFYGCKSLTSVTIPNSVISIGKGAFDRCDKLSEDAINYI